MQRLSNQKIEDATAKFYKTNNALTIDTEAAKTTREAFMTLAPCNETLLGLK